MYGRSSADLLKSGSKMILAGTTVFGVYNFISGNERFHKEIVIPAVHTVVDGETAHMLAVKSARYAPSTMWGLRNCSETSESSLSTNIFGIPFKNVVGLAAGFDKDCEASESLSASSGLGFVEMGSVTPLQQPGNAKPRVFRLHEDGAVINRYGFNSVGYDAFSANLERAYSSKQSRSSNCRVGVNLGKNKNDDNYITGYRTGYAKLAPFADYVVVNLSSPNTPGLRDLQNKAELSAILSALRDVKKSMTKNTPLLIKISPDLKPDDLVSVCNVICSNSDVVDGLVVSNTTTSRPNLRSIHTAESGGLSGAPLKQLSTDCIRRVYTLTKGKIPIIGCGGIFTGEDAYEKIRAGASLVQLYTALIYEGFPVVGKVKRELAACLKRDGFQSVRDAVGADSQS